MTTDEAIDHFGGIKLLADALGIWPHSIYRWGYAPPQARQYQLEVLSEGKLKADRSKSNG